MTRRLLNLLTPLSLLLCVAVTAGEPDPPQVSTRPASNAPDARVKCTLTVAELDGEWTCEVRLMNRSREVVTVPRGPTFVSWSAPTAEPPVVGDARAFRNVREVHLMPDEGFVKLVRLGKLEPGEYRLRAELPLQFRRWDPAPTKFTVGPVEAPAQQPGK